MKKFLFFTLIGMVLLNAAEISLQKFLNDYSNVHKNIEFFLLKKDNIQNFINDKYEKKYLNFNLNTLRYLLETKLGRNIRFKKIKFQNKEIVFLKIGNKKIIKGTFAKIINQLKKLEKSGEKLAIINPSFDYKNYKEDLESIIQKLKEYQRLSAK